MKAPRISNREASRYVNQRREFCNSKDSMYAEWRQADDQGFVCWYVVYSYGPHFPMYVFDDTTNKWYGNKDKYSSTTSRHQTHARPERIDEWVDTYTIRKFAYYGVVGAVIERMREAT